MRFVLGLIIGLALGAAAGLIIAPQSGRETREALRQRVTKRPDEEKAE